MKKTILCGAVVAALLSMTTLASAAEPAVVAHHGRGHGGHHTQSQTCQSGAPCTSYLDVNDDGICDHLTSSGRGQHHRTWTA